MRDALSALAASLALAALLGSGTDRIFGIYGQTPDELASLLGLDEAPPALVSLARLVRPLYERAKALTPSCTEALFPEFNDDLDMNDCLLLPSRVFWRAGARPLLVRQTMSTDEMWSSSTGSAVWGGGVALQHYMESELGSDYFRGKRVLELGTGTGLVSVTAAALGADVVATDRDADVLELAAENARLNLDRAAAARFRTAPLTWGGEDTAGERSVDLVLGADLTYNREAWPALVKTLRALRAPALLSASERRPHELSELEAYLREAGFALAVLDSPIEHGYARDRVRLLRAMPHGANVIEIDLTKDPPSHGYIIIEASGAPATKMPLTEELTVVNMYHKLDRAGYRELTLVNNVGLKLKRKDAQGNQLKYKEARAVHVPRTPARVRRPSAVDQDDGPVIYPVNSLRTRKRIEPSIELLTSVISQHFPFDVAVKEFIDNSVLSLVLRSLQSDGSAQWVPQIVIELGLGSARRLRVVDNGVGFTDDELEWWAAMGKSHNKERIASLPQEAETLRNGLFAQFSSRKGVGAKAAACASTKDGNVVNGKATAWSLQMAGTNMAGIEFDFKEAVRLNGLGKDSWERDILSEPVPADLLEYTKQVGWGDTFACIDVSPLSPGVRETLAFPAHSAPRPRTCTFLMRQVLKEEGAVDDLVQKLVRTYRYSLDEGLYEQIATLPGFDRARDPKPVNISMRVELAAADGTKRNFDLNEMAREAGRGGAGEAGSSTDAARGAGSRSRNTRSGGELKPFFWPYELKEPKGATGRLYLKLDYHPIEIKDGKPTESLPPDLRPGMDMIWQSRLLPEEKLRTFAFMSAATFTKPGKLSESDREFRNLLNRVQHRVSGQLFVTGDFDVEPNKTALHKTSSDDGAVALVRMLAEISIEDSKQKERYKTWLETCHKHDDEARFVFDSNETEHDPKFGYITNKLCYSKHSFIAPSTGTEAPLDDASQLYLWIWKDKRKFDKNKAVWARVKGFIFHAPTETGKKEMTKNEMEKACAVAEGGSVLFWPWTHEEGELEAADIKHIYLGAETTNGRIPQRTWDQHGASQKKEHKARQFKKMERDESAATGLNPATLGEVPLDDAFKGKLPMHGRIAARAVNVKGGLMNQRALEQAFGEKAELQFALSHKMSSKDGGGPDNDTGKWCCLVPMKPSELIAGVAWFDSLGRRLTTEVEAHHFRPIGEHKFRITLERKGEDGHWHQEGSSWDFSVRVVPSKKPQKLLAEPIMAEGMQLRLHEPFEITVTARDVLDVVYQLSQADLAQAPPKLVIAAQPKGARLKLKDFDSARIDHERKLIIQGVEFIGRLPTPPSRGDSSVQLEVHFAGKKASCKVPLTSGVPNSLKPVSEPLVGPYSSADPLPEIRLECCDESGNPVKADITLEIEHNGDTEAGEPLQIVHGPVGSKDSPLNCDRGICCIKSRTLDVFDEFLQPDREIKCSLEFKALVNAEAGSRFHESTATCTLELMLAEAESTRPGKLKLTAESEQVQCGGSFGLTITVFDSDGSELELSKYFDLSKHLELESPELDSSGADLSLGEWGFGDGGKSFQADATVTGTPGKFRLKLPKDHPFGTLDCDPIELELTPGAPHGVTAACQSTRLDDDTKSEAGVSENGAKLLIKPEVLDEWGNPLKSGKVQWAVKPVDEAGLAVWLEKSPLVSLSEEMLLPVWLLTKKPLDTPRKYNLRITATMTVDGKEKKMSNEDVEVKLQPSANAVGSVVLSRVAAQERMEGVEELDDADPIDLRTGGLNPVEVGEALPRVGMRLQYENESFEPGPKPLGKARLTLWDQKHDEEALVDRTAAGVSRQAIAKDTVLRHDVKGLARELGELPEQVTLDGEMRQETAWIVDCSACIPEKQMPKTPGSYSLDISVELPHYAHPWTLGSGNKVQGQTVERLYKELYEPAGRHLVVAQLPFVVQPGAPSKLQPSEGVEPLLVVGNAPVEVPGGVLAWLTDDKGNRLDDSRSVVRLWLDETEHGSTREGEAGPSGAPLTAPTAPTPTLGLTEPAEPVELDHGALRVPRVVLSGAAPSKHVRLSFALESQPGVSGFITLDYDNPASRDEDKRREEKAQLERENQLKTCQKAVGEAEKEVDVCVRALKEKKRTWDDAATDHTQAQEEVKENRAKRQSLQLDQSTALVVRRAHGLEPREEDGPSPVSSTAKKLAQLANSGASSFSAAASAEEVEQLRAALERPLSLFQHGKVACPRLGDAILCLCGGADATLLKAEAGARALELHERVLGPETPAILVPPASVGLGVSVDPDFGLLKLRQGEGAGGEGCGEADDACYPLRAAEFGASYLVNRIVTDELAHRLLWHRRLGDAIVFEKPQDLRRYLNEVPAAWDKTLIALQPEAGGGDDAPVAGDAAPPRRYLVLQSGTVRRAEPPPRSLSCVRLTSGEDQEENRMALLGTVDGARVARCERLDAEFSEQQGRADKLQNDLNQAECAAGGAERAVDEAKQKLVENKRRAQEAQEELKKSKRRRSSMGIGGGGSGKRSRPSE